MSNCSSHVCDCERRLDTSWGEGVRLISTRPHVNEKLARAGAVPEVESRRLETVISGDDWRGRLDEALAELTYSERSAAVAQPLDRPEILPVPVDDMIRRLETPWFDRVMNDGLLRPFFQPIVRLSDGSTFGREALIRAELDGRLLNGGELVDAARAHGEIFGFDKQCRTAAIDYAAPIIPDGETLFINFNPTAIYDPDICLRTTWAVARRNDFALSRVCFEVVESERFPDIEFLRRILARYRAEGATVALDDLGAGQTSLTYLRDLVPDIVKLDRGLISGIEDDDARARLVAALIDYAHDLGITVVAEGIETAAELDVVRGLGADLGQGWFFGRPEPGMSEIARVGDSVHA